VGSRIVRRLWEWIRSNVYALLSEKAEAGHRRRNRFSLADLASTAEIILSCLTNDEAVRRVYRPDGLLFHAAPGTIVLK
jgi:3-hydroxyisobutyrate dehydrogenase-like beta-hydroxyacid dehydrogenase